MLLKFLSGLKTIKEFLSKKLLPFLWKNKVKILFVVLVSIIGWFCWKQFQAQKDRIDDLNQIVENQGKMISKSNQTIANIREENIRYSENVNRLLNEHEQEIIDRNKELQESLETINLETRSNRTRLNQLYRQNPALGTTNISNLLGIGSSTP